MSTGIALMLLALTAVLTGAILQACPFSFSSSPLEIYLDPQPVFVDEGESFSISISIGNVEPPGVYAYQIALCYDTICLEAIDASIPEDHFLTPSSPSNLFIIDGGTIDNELGKVTFSATLLGEEKSKTGSGVMARVEFTAVVPGNSSLLFTDVILVDADCNEVPSSQIVLEHSSVSVVSCPPPPPSSPFEVYFSPQQSFGHVGEKFSTRIRIAKAPLPGIYAYKFSLQYNSTILEAVDAGVPEGSFLGTSTPEALLIIDNGTIDNVSGVVSFEATRLAPEGGKTGNGVLGYVEFLAVASGNCSLTIVDIALADQDGNHFPLIQYEQGQASVFVAPSARATPESPPSTPPSPWLPPFPPPELSVTPIQSSVGINDSLQVDILITNVSSPGLYAYELTLYYDCTLVKAVCAEIPEGHFLTPSSPENIFVVDDGTIDNVLGKVSFAVTLLGVEGGKTWSGVLATVEFKAVAAEDLTFQLDDVILLSSEAQGPLLFEERDCSGTVVPEFESIVMLQMLLILAMSVVVIAKRA
jgi:hypothetical protein